MVGFVDDDQIEVAPLQASGMLAPPSQRQRRDQAFLVPEAFGIAAQLCVVSGGAGDVELRLKLLPPLTDERSRGQHEHAFDHASQHVFLENHAGLDRFAEPDLVGEQHPAAKLLEHLAYRLDLVPEGLDTMQMRQAEQLVEALCEPETRVALTQAVPVEVACRRILDRGQERVESKLDAERDIDVDARQANRCGLGGGSGHDRRLVGRKRSLAASRHGRLAARLVSRRMSFARRHDAPAMRRLAALEDSVELTTEPSLARPAAGKIDECQGRVVQAVRFEHRSRQHELVLLRERQGAEQVVGIHQDKALGEALQEFQRTLGISIKQRRSCREQQEVSVARPCLHCLLGDRQQSGLAAGIGYRCPKQLVGQAVAVCGLGCENVRRCRRLRNRLRHWIKRQMHLRR